MNSIFTGVSGMQANQQAIDVIANNIANLNTVGFKAGRATFEETLVRTLHGGSTNGVNPMQYGTGVSVSTIDTMMTQGTPRPTGRTLDLAIVGSGFFVMTDGVNERYTRDGVFQLDTNNRLVMASNGMKAVGWKADITTGAMDTTAPAQGDLTIPLGDSYAVATGTVKLDGNIDTQSTSAELSFDAYDSLGTTHIVKVSFTKDASGDWQWTASSADGTVDAGTGTGTLAFGDNGHLTPGTTSTVAFSLTSPNGAKDPLSFAIDFSSITNLDGTIDDVQAANQDGLPKGTLNDFSIDANGKIFGTFSNGASRLLGQIALANFANPAGLSKEDGNLWNISPNSGLASIRPPSVEGSQISSGALEMSNVDLTTEFANLIITQRSFQANSRSITTSDEMLQDIMQLKR